MPFTLAQKKALANVPHVTGFLSMIGSCCIIKSTLTKGAKSQSIYGRLLIGMSCMDMIASFWWGLSTWPIPEGSPGVWGASGTTGTCTAQGFFTHLGIGAAMYNVCIAFYALLMNRFKWSEDRIQKVEPYMHFLSIGVPAGTGVAGLVLKLYNNANLWCWIAPFPSRCKDSFTYGEEGNCIRGDNAWIYRWAFGFGPVWFSLLTSVVAMMIVYCTVLQKERDLDRFQEDGVALRKQSKRVAWQAFWYIMAMYVTWLPATITRLLQTIPATKGKIYFPLLFCFACFTPMQGFFNFLVFFRGRFLRYRRQNPSAKLMETILYAAFDRRRRPLHMEKGCEQAVDITTCKPGEIATEVIAASL